MDVNSTETPFGKMPVLEENDGRMLGGSLAILRYLAEKREFDCAGSNDMENAWLAGVADFTNDCINEIFDIYFETDKACKGELHEKFLAEGIPKYLIKLNDMINDAGYLLYCSKMTWADIHLYQCLDFLVTTIQPDILNDFPGLAKLKMNVESDPNISLWIAKRPKMAI